MGHSWFKLICIVLFFLLTLGNAQVNKTGSSTKWNHHMTKKERGWITYNGVHRRKGEILVKLKENVSTKNSISQKLHRRLENIPYGIVTFDESKKSFMDLKDSLSILPEVSIVEPNIRLKSSVSMGPKFPISEPPNLDYVYEIQKLRLSKSGNSKKVKIVLIETGVDYNNSLLKENVKDGTNFIFGETLTSNDDEEDFDETIMDYHGHGTAIAGVICAKNNSSFSGINPNCDLYVAKSFNRYGIGALSDILEGIEWSIQIKADILVMAFGSYEASEILDEVIKKAHRAGIIIVSAVGNDNQNSIQYPAAFPEVISVGSHDSFGAISSFSNWSHNISIFAPGENLITTWLNNGIETFTGTSAACAYIAGSVSLALHENLKEQDIHELISETNIWAKNVKNPDDNEFPLFNKSLFLSSISKSKLSEIALVQFTSKRRVYRPQEEVELEIGIKNSGNQPVKNLEFLLSWVNEDSVISYEKFQISELSIDEHFTYIFKKKIENILNTEKSNINAKLELVNDTNTHFRYFNSSLKIYITDSEMPMIMTSYLSLNNLDLRDSISRVLSMRIVNTGNVDVDGLKIEPVIYSGSQQWLTIMPGIYNENTDSIPSLRKGESKIINIELMPFKAQGSGKITISAPIKMAGKEVSNPHRVFRTSPFGYAEVSQKQNVHEKIGEYASQLLEAENIYIPDIHSPFSTFFKSTSNKLGELNGKLHSTVWTPPSYWGDAPVLLNTDFTFLNGTWDEDAIDMAYCYGWVNTWMSHFWIVDHNDDDGHDDGSGDNRHSALNKMRAFMYGKSYNAQTSNACIEHGALDHYNAGYKSAAWYIVGHIAHLLADVATPEHVISENNHGVLPDDVLYVLPLAVGGTYEDWMEYNYSVTPTVISDMPKNNSGFIDVYSNDTQNDPLRFLAYTTAQVGDYFVWCADVSWSINAWTGAAGNYKTGGDYPHYEQFMQNTFNWVDNRVAQTGVPIHHPYLIRDLNMDEIKDKCAWVSWDCPCCTECQAVDWIDPLSEVRRDCWSPLNNHMDYDNTDGAHNSDKDSDLSAIKNAAMIYSIRSTAGLMYFFAQESGQFGYTSAAPVSNLLLF